MSESKVVEIVLAQVRKLLSTQETCIMNGEHERFALLQEKIMTLFAVLDEIRKEYGAQ